MTSPPYWGLRDYGVEGQLGLEPTPELYVSNLVSVFREVHRVLRDDGTVWLVIGDCYNTRRALRDDGIRSVVRDMAGAGDLPSWSEYRARGRTRYSSGLVGLKDKDLVLIPARVALALQADGWYLRSDIIWHKQSVLPESVKDRPTSCYEHVFLLAKSKRYYYDALAISEPASGNGPRNFGNRTAAPRLDSRRQDYTVRNSRNLWSINTSRSKSAHFATMPVALAERCILAGTSAHGCCDACGAPWRRELVWMASCACDAGVRPCTVIDPFAGSGTTGYAAMKNDRDAVLVELNPDYIAMMLESLL